MRMDITEIISMILVFLLIILFAGTPDLSDAISDNINARTALIKARAGQIKHIKEIK